ncbi:Membrane protease YdiL, CAAX protease family [Nocardioides alpinus]|uniref:CPBP family intramembrane metalloprotease n=1 Tax=Nocardioides alpinus TaxID=748909 RepID=A0A1I1AWZ9_9ACTN|nr:type II CAAX endopeptidase family protein [Nocardioides alpinus]PKH40909.1 CPBP family intramembrane metalloprotease [Nocardioides alpinus]SFB41926.1 Membrane protease YdiL, CAAX protease family [Nocardioides alpinus]
MDSIARGLVVDGGPSAAGRLCQAVRHRPAPAFVLLTFAFSWGAWLPQLAAVQGWLPMRPWAGFHLVGGLGPAVAAVVVTHCLHGSVGLRELGRRLVAWRGRRRAWTFALLVPPTLLVVAAPLSAWASGEGLASLDWSAFGSSAEFSSLPVAVWWCANLVFYGMGEELGWRGFLQPSLEETRSVVSAAGLVSLPWALWHLPLFGITPSYRAMPLIGLVGFALSIWVASLIFAWLLHLGRGSVLIVAVFHAWFDIVTTSPLGPGALPTTMGAAVTIVGLVVLRRMLRQPPAPREAADGAPRRRPSPE